MPSVTDPAREIADLCQRLRSLRQNVPGAQVLAEEFEVPVWSAEFYELVFNISKRIDRLKVITRNLHDVDQEIKGEAVVHLEMIQKSFGPEGLNNSWSHATNNFLSPTHVGPIRFLSLEVRHDHSFPKLDDSELAQLLADLDELLSWLREFQIKEQDFIRQALIDGLERVQFRVERLSWLGWEYTLDSLREVIGAYLALERGINPNESPDSQAVLKKVGSILKVIFEKVGMVRDISDNANWIIECYKNISAVAMAGNGVVALLTFAGKS